ncbi:uncharacterized protein OCT59_001281 [Rhizophagus irregularis]|nr:hypothetical protein RirG_257260 [Rhizophagus irregularis DAOM 197198w]UZO00027.1 hypothetical protein OCT59_001281 [Rhizophagus irregularis]
MNNREEKKIIKELWNFIYEEFRSRIWMPRCKEIARLEKIAGIQKQDLKRKRENDEEDDKKITKNAKTNKKHRKNITLNKNINLTRDRMIGSLTEGNSKGHTWDLTPKTFDFKI